MEIGSFSSNSGLFIFRKIESMKYSLLILTATLLWCSSCAEQPYIDVNELAGKTPEQVITIMGEPDTTYTKNFMFRKVVYQIYRDKKAEFRYPEEGKIQTILVKNTELPFAQETIERFGLEPLPPTTVIDNTLINWKSYPTFSNVSIYSEHLTEEGIPDKYIIMFRYKK